MKKLAQLFNYGTVKGVELTVTPAPAGKGGAR